MDEDFLPYNKSLDIYNKDYSGVIHRTVKIPDTQNYWTVPVIIKKVKDNNLEKTNEKIDEQKKEIDKNIDTIKENIQLTETKINSVKDSCRYFKYAVLILLLMFIYLIILLLLNMKIID